MLLCVLAEAFAALNLRTMHRAHLLYIASFCWISQFHCVPSFMRLSLQHHKQKHSRQANLQPTSHFSTGCTWTVSKRQDWDARLYRPN